MKKDIRVYWFNGNSLDQKLLENWMGDEYNFIIDPIEADYMFAPEFWFADVVGVKRLFEYKKEKKDRIYVSLAVELIMPDMNLFDYAICFDDNYTLDDRLARFPTLMFAAYGDKEKEEILRAQIDKKIENPRQYLAEKTDFCNFIYRNHLAPPMRDALFEKISEYKKVDSLGKHLNNRACDSPRSDPDWQNSSIELKRPYKFSIAAENARYNGYTSEKILTSFQADSIPIYWGNPNIVRDFNPKSFINCHDYKDLDAVLERVKEIDNNDELWLEMLSQPRRTKEQIELYQQDKKDITAFMRNIFDQDIKAAKRVPTGWGTDAYCAQLYKYSTCVIKELARPRVSFFGLIQKRQGYTSFLCGLIAKRYEDRKRIIYFLGIPILRYTKKKSSKSK